MLGIGELEPAGMAQHVRMDWEGHLGGLAEPSDHAAKPDGTHGCPALAHSVGSGVRKEPSEVPTMSLREDAAARMLPSISCLPFPSADFL